jgi:hypothetical protein
MVSALALASIHLLDTENKDILLWFPQDSHSSAGRDAVEQRQRGILLAWRGIATAVTAY